MHINAIRSLAMGRRYVLEFRLRCLSDSPVGDQIPGPTSVSSPSPSRKVLLQAGILVDWKALVELDADSHSYLSLGEQIRQSRDLEKRRVSEEPSQALGKALPS